MLTVSPQPSAEESTPVLIVGGSLVGLSTALFLAKAGTTPLLVERHAGTAVHLRVASLTARTREIFRSVGADTAIRQIDPPFENGQRRPAGREPGGRGGREPDGRHALPACVVQRRRERLLVRASLDFGAA